MRAAGLVVVVTVAGSNLCVGVYGGVLGLRKCNVRSLRQRWSLLTEIGFNYASTALNIENMALARESHIVCEVGLMLLLCDGGD